MQNILIALGVLAIISIISALISISVYGRWRFTYSPHVAAMLSRGHWHASVFCLPVGYIAKGPHWGWFHFSGFPDTPARFIIPPFTRLHREIKRTLALIEEGRSAELETVTERD